MPTHQTWFITGSSRGFGRALAVAALEAGDFVVATARKPEQLADLVASYGDRTLALPLDVTDATAARAAITDAHARFGRLDVVVNNAGYANVSPIETADDEDFRIQFETNFWGVYNVSKAAIPVCSENKAAASSCSSRRSAGGLEAHRESVRTRQRSSRSTASAGCCGPRQRPSG